MAFEDEVKKESDKVFRLMSINLAVKATRSALTIDEFIQVNREGGVGDEAIRGLLFEDLRIGGRIFGEFLNAMKTDIRGRMGQLADEVFLVKQGTAQKKKWITVSDNPCPDCLPRHNETDSDRNWELRGKPRTGWSVCRTNCKCKLIPVGQIARHGEVLEPIKPGG